MLTFALPNDEGKRVKRRTVGQSHFPVRAEGLSCETEGYSRTLFIMSTFNIKLHPNTHLCVDVKTLLLIDATMKAGKGYLGVLRREEICEEFRPGNARRFSDGEVREKLREIGVAYGKVTEGIRAYENG